MSKQPHILQEVSFIIPLHSGNKFLASSTYCTKQTSQSATMSNLCKRNVESLVGFLAERKISVLKCEYTGLLLKLQFKL